MGFGSNQDTNYTKPEPKKEDTDSTTQSIIPKRRPTTTPKTYKTKNKSTNHENVYIFGTTFVGGLAVLRLVMW